MQGRSATGNNMSVGSVLTVTKLNEYVSSILSNEPRLRSVRVSGEISGFKRYSSGHLYFNLKDSGAVVACVMFRSDAAKLSIDPRDGMQVVVRGSVNVYVRDGKYQLYASGMTAAGEGELYMAFLQLKERLQAEGVFENARQLPVLPRCIGIATSDTGAALRDMLNIIRRRFPKMNVLFAPCRVQGAGAAEEICASVIALQRFEYCDVIIVGRGGGSYEDLSCFNDEQLARTIAASRVPVVSAVGHETDFTVADFAADLRAPTPSAAAELCCPIYEDLAYQLSDSIEAAASAAQDRLSAQKRALVGLMGSAAMANPRHAVELLRQRLNSKVQSSAGIAGERLRAARAELSALSRRLIDASPDSIMSRGYAVITDRQGSPVCGIDGISPGDGVLIHMRGGLADATVNVVINDNR